jgi:hypothetical protein
MLRGPGEGKGQAPSEARRLAEASGAGFVDRRRACAEAEAPRPAWEARTRHFRKNAHVRPAAARL